MRKVGALLVLVLFVASCSTSSKAAPAPTRAATTPTTDFDYGAQYERIVAPVVAAEEAVSDTTEIAVLTPELARVADAIREFDRQLLALEWPPEAQNAVEALVVADGASVDTLDALDAQTAFSVGQWYNQFSSDLGRSTAASKVVRAKLGLPPK